MNLGVVLIFALTALLMIIMSIMRDDFTKSQMNLHGQKGYSGASHMGLWSDLLVLPWLCGIIWTYHDQWANYWPATLVALAITHLMHSLWLKNGPPDHNIKVVSTTVGESTVTRQYRLTAAGWTHYLYMFAVMILVIQFYFNTKTIQASHLLWVSVILGLHMTMSTLILNLVRQKKIDTVAALTTLVVWAVLALRLF